jgi:hypothetical protein
MFSRTLTGSVASSLFHLIQHSPWTKRCWDVFYGKMLQKTCGELDFMTTKLNYFDWKCGALHGEMQDIPILEIEYLGNWSTSQYEEAYSTTLQIKALRVIGGHDETNGRYFLSPGDFTPPE